MQFKTIVPSFIVFLAASSLPAGCLSFFFQFAGDAVGGVNLKVGSPEQQHHPIVVYIRKVMIIAGVPVVQ